jgi:hypothetical protein
MLPQALRDTPQWLVSGEDKAPRSPTNGGRTVDVTNHAFYVTYQEAISYADQHGLDIGFALTPQDPFAVIDLDEPENEEQAARHTKILDAFDTYAELSRSGKGVHIWCRGQLPHGARRDKVEVYPHSRYMICTGKSIKDSPISDCQSLLQTLYNEITSGQFHHNIELRELPALLTDAEVFDMGMRAANADKFDKLCRGDWQGDYPSQSEADYALMNMLCYYSRSNEQCKRLFRYSALGKRKKAHREKYLDMMIKKIRAEEPPPIDFSHIATYLVTPVSEPESFDNVDITIRGSDLPENMEVVGVSPNGNNGAVKEPLPGILYPPGFVGEIARYIVDSSVRPVPEVGITAALGLAAGVLGRQFNISNTGLNLYIILLAKTGVGKEGGAAGIERILKASRGTAPVVDSFMGPGTFASGQAIIRSLDEKPCFVSILGEFGLVLQDMSDASANTLHRVMRRVLLDLYGKSGKSSVLYSSAYSDKEKNTKTLYAPSLTILGESTPDAFYAGLSQQHIADGLIPRFLLVEHHGDRPDRNPNAFYDPPEDLVRRFVELVEISLRMAANQTWQDVSLDESAAAALRTFDKQCDNHIRREGLEGIRQLWNRAHLKALRLTALLAAADNPHVPVASYAHAKWAIDLVVRDSNDLSSRFERGDVGEGEEKEHADVVRIIDDYFEKGPEAAAKYMVNTQMFNARVIPHQYFQRRCINLAAFRKDRRGATRALKETIQSLVDAGLLAKVPAQQAYDEFGFRGILYHVL